MNKELEGKTVSVREYGIDGDTEHMNFTVLSTNESTITVRDLSGKIRIINLTSPRIVEVKES
jgi:predicted membrane protein